VQRQSYALFLVSLLPIVNFSLSCILLSSTKREILFPPFKSLTAINYSIERTNQRLWNRYQYSRISFDLIGNQRVSNQRGAYRLNCFHTVILWFGFHIVILWLFTMTLPLDNFQMTLLQIISLHWLRFPYILKSKTGKTFLIPRFLVLALIIKIDWIV